MNEKKNFRFIFTIVLLVVCFAGCRTVGSYTDPAVLEHQARVIELENSNRALAERLGQYDSLVERTVTRLEAIRERAGSITDTAERIEYLFTEYERAVQQLIYELRSSAGTSGTSAEGNKDITNSIDNLDWLESFTHYYWLYTAGT